MSYRINVPEGTANTMKLTILGATGATGTTLTGQALAAGHEVTAVVRDPARLAVPAHPRLRTVTADVMDPASIIQAMHKTGTRRLLQVSGSVVADEGESPYLRYLLKPLARRTFLRHVCADMRHGEEEIQDSDLDWTIFRPPSLTDKAATGAYRTAIDRNLPHGFTVSRADLAACMLASLSDPATVHRHVAIAS